MTYYAIINESEKHLVDFNYVIQNPSTVRYSLDHTKFVIKYHVEPEFITNGTVTPVEILTHSECLALMSSADWSEQYEL